MNSYLLDTHIFIWLATGNTGRLRRSALSALEDPDNVRFFSPISVAEIELKISKGKINLPFEWDAACKKNCCLWLPFHSAHAVQLRHLPLLHRDPFDRMLIAQAIAEELILVTHDDELLKYPVKTLRA